jgi:hypothetical protein
MLVLGLEIIRRLLGKLGVIKFHSPMLPADALAIINDYGSVMLHKSPAPFYISDVKKLPHSKDTIKQALLMILRVNGKSQLMDALKIGYLQLANWQEGVGELDLAVGTAAYGEDKVDSVKSVTPHLDDIYMWNDILEEERMSLKNDLVRMGVW